MASFLVRPRNANLHGFYAAKRAICFTFRAFLWSARNRFSIDKPQIERDFNIRFVSRLFYWSSATVCDNFRENVRSTGFHKEGL